MISARDRRHLRNIRRSRKWVLPALGGLWLMLLATSAYRVEKALEVAHGFGAEPLRAWNVVLKAPEAGRSYQAYEVYLVSEAHSIQARVSEVGILTVLAYVYLRMERLLAALEGEDAGARR